MLHPFVLLYYRGSERRQWVSEHGCFMTHLVFTRSKEYHILRFFCRICLTFVIPENDSFAGRKFCTFILLLFFYSLVGICRICSLTCFHVLHPRVLYQVLIVLFMHCKMNFKISRGLIVLLVIIFEWGGSLVIFEVKLFKSIFLQIGWTIVTKININLVVEIK